MFQAQTFRPVGGPAFLPQIRLAGFQPPAFRQQLRGPILGYSLADGQKMYEDAKTAIRSFDDLAIKIAKISYKPERDKLIDRYGLLQPDDNDKALNQRNDLQEYVNEVEKMPGAPNYYVFIQDTTRPRNRLKRVQSDVLDMARDEKYAEDTYGLLPEPQVIIKEVMVPGAPGVTGEAGKTDYTIPLLVGAGAVTLALIFA